jgi:hypothetical protein
MGERSSVRPNRQKRTRRGTRVSRARKSGPVWQELLRIARAIPGSDLHKLPTDLSVNHDHYLYGSNEA